MELKFKFLTFFCLAGFLSYGQSMPSLTVAPDARSAAMGATGTATSADAYSIYWNTAKSIFARERGAMAYTYIPDLNRFSADFRQHNLAGYYKLNDKNALLAGFRYFQNGILDIGDQEIKPEDYTISLGYSRKVCGGFSLGAAVRYLHSDLKMISAEDAVVFDLGAYYNAEVKLLGKQSVVAVGVNFTNFGTKVGDEYAPAMIKAGASLEHPFTEHHQLSVAADFGYQVLPVDEDDWDASVGAEYWYRRLVAVRAGYHWGDVDKGNTDYFSLGCGVCYYHVHADFSYLLASDSSAAIDKTWRLTVGIDLGLFQGKKK